MIPARMKLLNQFEKLFEIESEMLLLHIRLLREYIDGYGYDKWARELRDILNDESRHVKLTNRLLEIATDLEGKAKDS